LDAKTKVREVLEDTGQGLVEFALVLPVFMVIVLGLVDFGSAFNIHNNMTQLAGEAARFAAVNNCDCPNIANQVRVDANNGCLQSGSCGGVTGLGPDQRLVVCFTAVNDDGTYNGSPSLGDPITAVVETNYRWLPFLGFATSQLKATATMRLEQLPTPTGPYALERLTADGNCSDYGTPGP
jgi:Flp pilus assembly protein TadG